MRQFLTVFITTFKYLWRNPVSVAVIAFFPIVIILLLGNALSSYISPENDLDPIPVAYVTDNGESMFAEFLKSDEIVRFLDVEDMDENSARAALEDSESEISFAILEKDGEISALQSSLESSNMDISIALSIINSYRKISTAVEIAIENGADPNEVMQKAGSEFNVSVEDRPLGKRVPNATDYYAVTMIVYILLLAGMNGLELFGKSLLGDMGGRIRSTPVSKPALIGGLIASATVSSFLQGMVTFVFTAAFYGVYWGERIPLVLLTLFAVVLFSQAMAIFLLLLFKNGAPAIGAMQALFWVTTFVSKGYAKVSFGEAADKVFAYAPNALAQTTIFGAIYGGNESKMMFSLSLLFILAGVFFVLAFLIGRRRFA